MKKFRLISIFVLIAAMLFGGMLSANAVTSIPTSVVSDAERQIEFIDKYPIILKTADNGKYYIYCMNQSRTFAGGIKFTKTGTVDPGFAYILKNRPQTNNKNRDFYVTQMAVWYFEDYLNQNNDNLEYRVKEYIIAHKDNANDVSKDIYDLYYAAKQYHLNNKDQVGSIKFDASNVKFTEVDGYFVSSEIKITKNYIDGDLTYSLENAPAGTTLVQNKTAGYVKLKIPVDKIPEGKQVTVKITAKGSYTKATAYYYHYTNAYQDVLYQDPITQTYSTTASVSVTAANYPDTYPVTISKTDVTKSKEIAGATLVVKDSKGSVVSSWVSTTTAKTLTLAPGSYTLTETVAPAGYKLATSSVEFKLDEYGIIYTKNSAGVFVVASKVVMVNELEEVKPDKYPVVISKTDVTQSKEVAGATLVVKDETGAVVATWVSTTTAKTLTLAPGKYYLSETIAPAGYKLSTTTISFILDENGIVYAKNDKDVFVIVNKVVMINELLDMVSFEKRDSSTRAFVSGAKLVIKDSKGAIVKEFTTTNTVYSTELDPGYYTLSEVSAPKGYLLSNEVIYFYLKEDGTLQVKNEKGEYADTAMITFYNTKEKEEEVDVPSTDKNSTLLVVSGIALLIGGLACAKKTIKEC